MTFSLGATSLKRLEGVHPDLVRVVQAAIRITAQDFTVQEGLRTIETQREYVKRGVSKTLASKHLKQADGFGHAVDLVPWIAGQPRWEWPPIYEIAVAMHEASEAEGVRLVFGGVWDRTFNDLLVTNAGSVKHEVEAYAARHPGPDLLDGPHWQLA